MVETELAVVGQRITHFHPPATHRVTSHGHLHPSATLVSLEGMKELERLIERSLHHHPSRHPHHTTRE